MIQAFSRRAFFGALSGLGVLAGFKSGALSPVTDAEAQVTITPLANFDDKAWWDSQYEVGAEGAWGHPNTRSEVQLNYHRFTILPIERDRAQRLATALGWGTGTRLVVAHCGFGWILEAFADLGISVVGTAPYLYIQGNKSLNEDADLITAITAVGLTQNVDDGLTLFTTFRGDGGPRSKVASSVLNESLTTNTSRSNVRTALGGGTGYEALTFDGWLGYFSDADAVALAGEVRKLVGLRRLVHHVYASGVPNAKTLEDWKTLIPADTFVEARSYRVV